MSIIPTNLRVGSYTRSSSTTSTQQRFWDISAPAGSQDQLSVTVQQQTAQLRSDSMLKALTETEGPIGLAVHGPQLICAILEALRQDDVQVGGAVHMPY